MTDRRHRSKVLLVLAGALAAGTCSTAAATAPVARDAGTTPNQNAADGAALDRTVRFLQDAQHADGGWGGSPTTPSDPMFTAWVALALAAAGVNPRDQAREGGTDAFSYLAAHASELELTTDFDRALLVVDAAGTSPRNFGQVDLVARILERQLPDGSFKHATGDTIGGINDTAFAVIALSPVDDPEVRAALRRATDWLRAHQGANGGWGWSVNTGSSTDMTASVIEALRAAGVANTDEERDAWVYLRGAHRPADGGFAGSPSGRASNTASTAWAVQGMWAAGLEPRTWAGSARTPLDFLSAAQEPATGMIRLEASRVGDQRYTDSPIWMTAYATPAFAGYPLPIPAVARSQPKLAEPTPTPAPADQGVTSGGGGAGAPAFSRPEPQSSGAATGGIRQVDPAPRTPADATSGTKRDDAPSAERRDTSGSNGTAQAGITRDRADDAATRTAGAAGARNAPAAGRAAGAAAAPGDVVGQVVSVPRAGAAGTGDPDAAAPGLRSADEQRAPAIAAGLAALLLLALATGITLERQQVQLP